MLEIWLRRTRLRSLLEAEFDQFESSGQIPIKRMDMRFNGEGLKICCHKELLSKMRDSPGPFQTSDVHHRSAHGRAQAACHHLQISSGVFKALQEYL